MKSPRLHHNIAALGFAQVLSYLLTLATLPYVTRVLGVEEWGRVAFAQVVLNYFIWFTNWGFYLHATQRVAVVRNEPEKLKKIFMTTWVSQWLLAVIAIVSLLAMTMFVPFFSKDAELYIYGVGLIVGNVLFPIWFLTGLEKIKAVAVVHVLMKAPAVPLIFLLVNDQGDAPTIFMINSITVMAVGLLVIRWVHAEFYVIGELPSWHDVSTEIIGTGKLFISSAWVNFYNALTPIVLGIIGGPASVGVYSIADRARTAVFAIHAPVSNALFPRMSLMYAEKHGGTKRLLAVSGLGIGLVMALASASLWVFSEAIVVLLGGEEFRSASSVLAWLSPLPLVVGLSTFLSMQVLLPAKLYKAYYRIYWAGGLLSVSLIVPFVTRFGPEGAAMNTLLTESVIVTMMIVYLANNRYCLSKK
jgi:O-antigen/teichoic acid export membrane protein